MRRIASKVAGSSRARVSASLYKLRAALANANIAGKVTINTEVRLNKTNKRDNTSQNRGSFTGISPKRGLRKEWKD